MLQIFKLFSQTIVVAPLGLNNFVLGFVCVRSFVHSLFQCDRSSKRFKYTHIGLFVYYPCYYPCWIYVVVAAVWFFFFADSTITATVFSVAFFSISDRRTNKWEKKERGQKEREKERKIELKATTFFGVSDVQTVREGEHNFCMFCLHRTAQFYRFSSIFFSTFSAILKRHDCEKHIAYCVEYIAIVSLEKASTFIECTSKSFLFFVQFVSSFS